MRAVLDPCQVEPGTTTVLAVGPAEAKDLDAITGHLKTLPDCLQDRQLHHRENDENPPTFGVPYFQTKPYPTYVNPSYFQPNRDSSSILGWP